MSRDALVVGIGQYAYLQNLRSPAPDAEAIAEVLTHQGSFRVQRLPEVVDADGGLRVGAKTPVTLPQLEEALVKLFKPTGEHLPDTALLYFSGHGLRKDRGIQEGFLATSDVNPQQGFYGLSLQWLRRLLQDSPVRQQIIWLDCCHSGELLNFDQADPGDRGQGRDRCFIAASREYEVAYEETTGPHGVLTGALLQALDPARSPSGATTNFTVSEHVEKALKAATQRPLFANSGHKIMLTGRQTVAQGSVLEGKCPYKGLSYFDCNDEDPHFFYGRTALTDALIEKVREGNFLAVLGASGSGKSSVVRAGLVHQLQQGKRLSGSDAWSIYILRPGEHPLQSLAAALVEPGLSAIDRASQLQKAQALVNAGAVGLRQFVTASPNRVVLVIDQFEECFTLCRDRAERELFFDCILGTLDPQPLQNDRDSGLAELADDGQKRFPREAGTEGLAPSSRGNRDEDEGGNPTGNRPGQSSLRPRAAQPGTGSNYCLVIALRADFLGKCFEQDYSGLSQQIESHMVAVRPMTRQELEQAIVEPANQVGLEVEAELVSQMIIDVEGSPGSLPLLQYTLTELWHRRVVNWLTFAAYTELGGVRGTLEQRAEEVFESLAPPEQTVAKRIFLELTQLGEGTEDTRRQVPKWELITPQQPKALTEQVIQRLLNARLLVSTELVAKNLEGGRVEVIDVAHEALIRYWSRLRGWIEDNRVALKQKRDIETMAEDWIEQSKSSEAAYLLQGSKLLEAERYLDRYGEFLPLSTLACELVTASQQRRDRQLRQERNRKRWRRGVTIALPSIAAVFLSILGLREYQSKQALEAIFLSNSPDKIARKMPNFLASARALAQGGTPDDIALALAYYRQVMASITRLERERSAPLPTTLQDAHAEAEDKLANLIAQHRLPLLTGYLQSDQIGVLLPDVSLTDFERQFSEGALRATYQILMQDFGAGADINHDGQLSPDEALLMPCETLLTLEKEWAAVKPACAWDGSSCLEFKVNETQFAYLSLPIAIFGYDGVASARDRIDLCRAQLSTRSR